MSGQFHAPVDLYPRKEPPGYPLDRRLGGPQGESGRFGEEKSLALTGNRTLAVQPFARRYTGCRIPLVGPPQTGARSVVKYRPTQNA
jgi:hypothetical protein